MNWDQNKELVEQILRTGMYAKLYGVKFLLYDEDRNPIGEFTSDDDGYVYITADDLPDGANTSGRFYLRELEAAEGYILDKEYKTVYVRPGRTAEIEWVNEAITGQIQIYKYAAEANSVTGVPAGTPSREQSMKSSMSAAAGWWTTSPRTPGVLLPPSPCL